MAYINLDHLSANSILPEVQDAMIDTIKNNYGNPSSQHTLGDKAATALEKARESVAGPNKLRYPEGDCIYIQRYGVHKSRD